MKSRRALLAALGLGLPGLALAAGAKPAAPQARKAPAYRGGRSATGWKVPQAKVKDQHGREFKFYDDLVKNKLVLISFASIDGEKRYPIVENLVKMQQMIGSRMGKDVFVYTVSTRPERDTPEALKTFAEKKGAKWQFLTGTPSEIAKIKQNFGVMGSVHGLVWITNDATSRWLTKPARLQSIFLAEAVSFLSTGAQHKRHLRDMRSWKS